jgi:undecaprenyl-diphosphatase
VRAGLVIETCAGLVLWKRWRSAAFLAATVSATGVINTGLKTVVDRHRPQPFLRLQLKRNSFPSGHAGGSAALAAAASYLVWLLTGRRAAAVLTGMAGGAFAGAVGYSRVRLHRHHPGDVLAGYALGLGCVATGIVLDKRIASETGE